MIRAHRPQHDTLADLARAALRHGRADIAAGMAAVAAWAVWVVILEVFHA